MKDKYSFDNDDDDNSAAIHDEYIDDDYGDSKPKTQTKEAAPLKNDFWDPPVQNKKAAPYIGVTPPTLNNNVLKPINNAQIKPLTIESGGVGTKLPMKMNA